MDFYLALRKLWSQPLPQRTDSATPRSSAICFPMVVPLDLGDLLLSELVLSIDASWHLYMDSRTISIILPVPG